MGSIGQLRSRTNSVNGANGLPQVFVFSDVLNNPNNSDLPDSLGPSDILAK